jgi:hypothetical protein
LTLAIYIYIDIPLFMDQKTVKALYIKIPEELHQLAREYALKRKIKGGVSTLVRDFLAKKTGYAEK